MCNLPHLTAVNRFYVSSLKDACLVMFMCLQFTRMPGESYCRRFGSLLLCSWDVRRELIAGLIWFLECIHLVTTCFSMLPMVLVKNIYKKIKEYMCLF